jgi:hypothetical protein
MSLAVIADRAITVLHITGEEIYKLSFYLSAVAVPFTPLKARREYSGNRLVSP